jgi:orotidine-5'-phosphate decarboxylase
MGLDPKVEVLPLKEGMNLRERVNDYFNQLFHRMVLSGLFPSAFKPNIGYYHSLDKPREEDFTGSLLLCDVLDMLDAFFPGVPVILDSKRGDIARSSLNYAQEAFDCWQTDAVTVSPYMGSDSVSPFFFENKGIYVLNRTSNPGGADLQSLPMHDEDPLYLRVAKTIAGWAEQHPGLGAVVGATNMEELGNLASFYADKQIPLLIPGVGSQGGSASDVMRTLQSKGYPVKLARINSSSGLTHPWKKGEAPEDWLDLCMNNLKSLIEEASV